MFIYGEDEVIAQWVLKLIPHITTSFGPCTAFGYASEEGKLLAGFVFNSYQREFGTIELTMAAISPMWARHKVIHEVLSYPFEQLNVFKVYTVTPAENKKALKVNAHIGFEQEAILAHQFGKRRHAVIRRMLRPKYFRLFGERNEFQRRRPSTRSGESLGDSGSASQL